MKRSELVVLGAILKKKYSSLIQLATDVKLNYSTISSVLSDLKNKGFNFDGLSLKNNSLLTSFNAINHKYSLDILEDKKEPLLYSLLFFARISELSKYLGLSEIQVKRILSKLRERGVVLKNEDKFSLNEDIKQHIENIYNFVKSKEIEPYAKYITRAGKIFKIVEVGKPAKGKLTAFSMFNKYGILYYLINDYYVVSDDTPTIEEVFVHSLFLSDSKKDYAMVICFYLKNRLKLNINKIEELVRFYRVSEIYEKLLGYVREGKPDSLFLPKKEFVRILNEYSLSMDSLSTEYNVDQLFQNVGSNISKELEVFLIGGGNLMLRKIKSVTKDTDIIVKNEFDYKRLEEELLKLGFEKDVNLTKSYDNLRIRMVFRNGNIQIDVFVKTVMNHIFLNDLMIKKSEIRNYGKLQVKFVSLEDVILFKAIAGREGDVEDIQRILDNVRIDWNYLYTQFIAQFVSTKDLHALSVLETLELVAQNYNIPIISKIERFVLEKAILFICKAPKSILEIKKTLEFPDHTIRNVINKQMKDGLLKSIFGKPLLFQTVPKQI